MHPSNLDIIAIFKLSTGENLLKDTKFNFFGVIREWFFFFEERRLMELCYTFSCFSLNQIHHRLPNIRLKQQKNEMYLNHACKISNNITHFICPYMIEANYEKKKCLKWIHTTHNMIYGTENTTSDRYRPRK